MNKIIVGEWGRVYTKKIYEFMKNKNVELWIRYDSGWRVYTDGDISAYKVVKNPVFKNDKIVRWANRIALNLSKCTVYNKAEAIKLATSKGSCREFLHSKGIKVPKIVTSLAGVTFPIIARPQDHAAGSDFKVLNTKDEYNYFRLRHPDWYYSEFFPKDRELRAHCAFGKILSLVEKSQPDNKTNMCWSMGEDRWNIIPWSQYHYNTCLEALKAVEALGLDIGAVDVMVKGDEAVVLEVNTAPGISPYTEQRYAEFLNWLFSDGEKKHWEFTKFKKADSFAWKHNQLEHA